MCIKIQMKSLRNYIYQWKLYLCMLILTYQKRKYHHRLMEQRTRRKPQMKSLRNCLRQRQLNLSMIDPDLSKEHALFTPEPPLNPSPPSIPPQAEATHYINIHSIALRITSISADMHNKSYLCYVPVLEQRVVPFYS